jgi:hypothetical protein
MLPLWLSEVDDVSTADLKYALVPAFLGDVCLKISWDASRAEHIKASTRFLRFFLAQCAILNILTATDRRIMENLQQREQRALAGQPPPKADPAAEREEKLDRLRRKKDATAKMNILMAKLQARIKQSGADAADDADEEEDERGYVLTCLSFHVLQSFDHLNISARELEVLAMRPQYERVLEAEAQGDRQVERAKPKVMRIEPTAAGPAVVSANFQVDSQGNMIKDGSTGQVSVGSFCHFDYFCFCAMLLTIICSLLKTSLRLMCTGGMKLTLLNEQINLRAHFEKSVFKEFNPPTMDEAEYMQLLHERGFFQQGGGYGHSLLCLCARVCVCWVVAHSEVFLRFHLTRTKSY